MLLRTMGINIQKPCVVYEDNRACIKIAENATAMKRTKHIDIRHHFLREHTENGTIKVTPVVTKDQLADAMTKVLGKVAFHRFRDAITSDVDLTSTDRRTCARYSDRETNCFATSTTAGRHHASPCRTNESLHPCLLDYPAHHYRWCTGG